MGTFWVRINQFFFTNKLMNQLETLISNHLDGGNELKGYIQSLISNRLDNPNDKELISKENELKNLIHFDYDITTDLTFQLHNYCADGTMTFDNVEEAVNGVTEANNKKFWEIDEIDRDSNIDCDTYELSQGEIVDLNEDFEVTVNIHSLNKNGASSLLLDKERAQFAGKTIESKKKKIEDLNKEINRLVTEVNGIKVD